MKTFQHKGFTVVRWAKGMFGSNIYLIAPTKGEGGLIVDAGGATRAIGKHCRDNGVKPTHLILTHKHLDHVISARFIASAVKAKILMGAGDSRGKPFADGGKVLHDGDRVPCGALEAKIVATPGHTPGGICVKIGDALFTGDTLFAGSIGRTDFRGGDMKSMTASLRKLLSLPADTVVYPGHGPETDLRTEAERNPFLIGIR